jgi:hypothetical protein
MCILPALQAINHLDWGVTVGKLPYFLPSLEIVFDLEMANFAKVGRMCKSRLSQSKYLFWWCNYSKANTKPVSRYTSDSNLASVLEPNAFARVNCLPKPSGTIQQDGLPSQPKTSIKTQLQGE